MRPRVAGSRAGARARTAARCRGRADGEGTAAGRRESPRDDVVPEADRLFNRPSAACAARRALRRPSGSANLRTTCSREWLVRTGSPKRRPENRPRTWPATDDERASQLARAWCGVCSPTSQSGGCRNWARVSAERPGSKGRAHRVLCNLRHSCLTKLADAGVPDTTALGISGHRRDVVHRCHVITQTATKVAALAVMAATVERVRQGLGRGRMTLLQDHRRAVKNPTSLARRRSSVG